MRARSLTDDEARAAAWIGGVPTEGKTRREIDAAIEGWPLRERKRSMDPKLIAEVAAGAAVVATIGGAIKHFAKPGGKLYKVGAFLSTLGTDVVSLVKLGGSVPPAGGAS